MGRIVLATLLLILSTSPAIADVNTKDASFKTSFVDLELGRLKVTRQYDSRSTFRGVFGYGWCSNLDAVIEKESDVLTVSRCGRKQVFKPQAKAVTHRWVTGRDADGWLEQRGTEIVHLDSSGRELEWFAGTDRISLLRDAATGEGRKVRLERDDSGKVLKLQAPNGQGASYEYEGENLIKVRNAWKNTYLFSYDRLHNLTQVSYPDRTFQNMTYDLDADRLTSLQGRGGCTERYLYTFRQDLRSRTQVTTAIKNCAGAEVSRVAFEFRFTLGSERQWQLASLKLSRNGAKTSEIQYQSNDRKGAAL